MEDHFKIYTVVRIDRDAKAIILYCGQCKETADEVAYMDRADESAPDKDDALKWDILVSKFPRWDLPIKSSNKCATNCVEE